MDHISIGVYDYDGKKLCDLYDSSIQADGQAYNIIYTQELNGWKELTFNLPFITEAQHNFRWDYIRGEYQIRLDIENMVEWFIIQKPKPTKNTKSILNNVTCPHLSALLKTKNLYLVFDDETGIGTIDELIERALSNTGWEIGECDTLYERDGTTEKIRSLTSDGKKGAYQLITDICNLFKAYPVYHGDTKTVDIHALNNKGPMAEMYIGKNLNAITVESSTENIITRLYVEGEYGDYGYVGIDSENPTGLSYQMNFDYYRSIGAFKDAHETAYNTYVSAMGSVIQSIKTKSQAILTAEDRLNTLWGQIKYVVYTLNGGTITKTIPGGTVTDEQKVIAEGDTLYVLKTTGNYREVTAGSGGSVTWANDDTLAVKFITLPSGLIGSKQVAVESKQKLITTLTKDKNNETDPAKQQSIQDQIDVQTAAITELYSGYITYTLVAGGYYTTSGETVNITSVTADTEWKNALIPCTKDTKFYITGHGGSSQRLWCFVNAENSDIAAASLSAASASAQGTGTEIIAPENATHLVCNFNAAYSAVLKQHILNGDGLYAEMREAVEKAVVLNGLQDDLQDLQSDQLGIESAFSEAMGDMLRDGYWSDSNYAPGQEQYLYQDAIDVINQMSKPTVTYTFSQVGLSEAIGFTERLPEINDKVTIWDDELKLNDIVYVSKQTRYQDKPRQDTVEVTNDDPALSGQSFESIMSRISQLADLLDQKNTLYERAGAITASGTIYAERLNGAIDVLKNKLSSTISNWYTDDSGALVFESVAGDSAMMLSGGGWMIADGKTQDGDWNWRTAADGKGIVADRITVGYLSADRIEAGSITVAKVSSDFGGTLDLSVNTSVTNVTSTHITLAEDHLDIGSGGELNIEADADINVEGHGKINVASDGEINIASGGKLIITSTNFTIDSSGNVSMTGVVTASSGTIGGWTLASTLLSSGSGAGYVALCSDASGTYAIWCGNETASSAPFSVTRAGAVKATSGTVGGWTLGFALLSSGSGAGYVAIDSNTNDTYAIWAGNETAASAPFSVSRAGALSATSGAIGGWTLGPSRISSGGGASFVALDSATQGTYAIWAGDETAASATFSVTRAGVLHATGATISGTVTANAGVIGGWNLVDSTVNNTITKRLYSGSSTNYVAIDAGSTNMTYAIWAGSETAGNAPFRVNRDGTVYLSKLYAIKSGTSYDPEHPESAQYEAVDLKNYSFWKLNYSTVRSITVGTNSLEIVTTSGTYSVNFKTAADLAEAVAAAHAHSLSEIVLGSGDTGTSTQSVTVFSLDDEEIDLNTTVDASAVYTAGKNSVTVTGSWSDGIYTATTNAPTPQSVSTELGEISTNGNPTVSGTYTIVQPCKVTLYGGGTVLTDNVSVNGSSVYTAGQNSVTISNSDIVRDGEDDYNSSTHNTTIYIEATASNGQQGTQSFTVSGTSAYSAGVTAGEAKFTQVSVTPVGTPVTPVFHNGYRRGSKVTVTKQGAQVGATLYAKAGDNYYELSGPFYYAGSSEDYYTGGDYFSYYDVGSSATLYQGGTATTYYSKTS